MGHLWTICWPSASICAVPSNRVPAVAPGHERQHEAGHILCLSAIFRSQGVQLPPFFSFSFFAGGEGAGKTILAFHKGKEKAEHF